MKLLTKDFYEAAYLLAKGMRICRVMGSPKTVLLELEGPEELDVLKDKYRKREAEVNVHNLKKQMKEVKDIVFTVLREAKANGRTELFSLTFSLATIF